MAERVMQRRVKGVNSSSSLPDKEGYGNRRHDTLGTPTTMGPPASVLHCLFIIKEDIPFDYLKKGSMKRDAFMRSIGDGISESLTEKLRMKTTAKVTAFNEERRAVFIEVVADDTLDDYKITMGLHSTSIVIDDRLTIHVKRGSIVTRDRFSGAIAKEIAAKGSVSDRVLNKSIDLDRQYVRLRIVPTDVTTPPQQTALENLTQLMKRDEKLELPDLYQSALEMEDREEVSDEELLKEGKFYQYTLVRGRAGIGKSTLLQRLVWKWAFHEWATQLNAIFLLNVRYMISTEKMDFASFLRRCTIYKPENMDSSFWSWFLKNITHIAIVLDGIDEIPMFDIQWKKEEKNPPNSETATPIEWCFKLLQKKCHEKVTTIVTSRPFKHLELVQPIMAVELMGLTRARVMEFVERNVSAARRSKVRQNLEDTPILLSVSAITFYCAALCELLEHQDLPTGDLNTYTQITAYILEMYLKRSIKTTDFPPILTKLASLADKSLAGTASDGIPRLVFNEGDFKDLDKVYKEEILNCGILFVAKDIDPDNPGGWFIQFVHLCMQEFLAMADLLTKEPEVIKDRFRTMLNTKQFTMAQMFLFGLAFNKEKPILKKISNAIAGSNDLHTSAIREGLERVLLGGKQGGKEDSGSDHSTLDALQMIHESQSQHLTRAIAHSFFGNTVILTGMKVTVLDIIAVTFLLKTIDKITTIRMERVGIDWISLSELFKYLDGENSISVLRINDTAVNDDSFEEAKKVVKGNDVLQDVQLECPNVGQKGAEDLQAMVRNMKSLWRLSVTTGDLADDSVAAKFIFTSMAIRSMQHSKIRYKHVSTINYNSREGGLRNEVDINLSVLTARRYRKTELWHFECKLIPETDILELSRRLEAGVKIQYISIWPYLTKASGEALYRVIDKSPTLKRMRIRIDRVFVMPEGLKTHEKVDFKYND